MGNRGSRNKSQKSHKTSKKEENQALRTRSLNSLPIGERSPSKPKAMSQSVRERKYVVSEQCVDTDVLNATRHRRQNTAPEIIVQSTPRSLKISDFSKVMQQPEPPQEEAEFNIPIEKALEPTPDELCQICSVFTGKIKFLCRICYQVYHLGCLQKIEQHEPSPVVCYLNRADTDLGWSCHNCDNVSRLLTESEMALLIYTLEQYNIRQGSSIFRQQFLYYKKAAFRDRAREEMPQDKLTDERCVFDKLDKKHTGRISWEDFINSEAINMLRNRPKRKLVKLLTQAELFRCRQKFMEYDHDRDGEITRFESLKSQMKSYSDLSCFPTPTPSKLLYSNEEIGGVMNWMEFLQHQAITVIASRRNSFCNEPSKETSENLKLPKIPPRTPEIIIRKRTNFVDSEVRNTLTEIVPALNTLTVISPVSSRSASPIPIGTVDVKSDVPAFPAHADDPKVSITENQTLNAPPVLLRSGRSKSAIVRSRAENSPNLTKPVARLSTTKSVNESVAETDISNGSLKKSPNINLLEESAPKLLQPKHNDISEVSTENIHEHQNDGVTHDINESFTKLAKENTLDTVSKADSKDSVEPIENRERIQRHSMEGEVDVVRQTDISNGSLKKSPNFNLLEESAPKPLQSKHNDISEVITENLHEHQNDGVTHDINESFTKLAKENTLDSVSKTDSKDSVEPIENKSDDERIQRHSIEGEVDVVRRFPKNARNHTLSMYIYESNRNTFGNEIRSIRRPVSVVGFKMEPTETVSRLSMNLKRPASSPQHSILPIIRKEIKNNGPPKSPNKDQEKATKLSNKENQLQRKSGSPRTSAVCKIPSPLKQCSDPADCGVERRGKKRLNDDIVNSKCDGKYRASDSEVLKAEKVPKTNRSQTTSLFVTRNERAVLIDQNDGRPLSLG